MTYKVYSDGDVVAQWNHSLKSESESRILPNKLQVAKSKAINKCARREESEAADLPEGVEEV